MFWYLSDRKHLYWCLIEQVKWRRDHGARCVRILVGSRTSTATGGAAYCVCRGRLCHADMLYQPPPSPGNNASLLVCWLTGQNMSESLPYPAIKGTTSIISPRIEIKQRAVVTQGTSLSIATNLTFSQVVYRICLRDDSSHKINTDTEDKKPDLLWCIWVLDIFAIYYDRPINQRLILPDVNQQFRVNLKRSWLC